MSDEMRPGQAATRLCAERVSPEQLSAWRDGLVAPERSAWLATHTARCAACSERLRDYNRIGAALREQVIPHPTADLWPETRRRLMERGARRSWTPTPTWGKLGAVIAATLLVALFAGLLARQASLRPGVALTPTTNSASPAASATTDTSLAAWTQIPGYQHIQGLAVAPSNPSIAYQVWFSNSSAPADNRGSGMQLRRTDDQGATWTDLPKPQIPSGTYPVLGLTMAGFVSPLDARVVFLEFDAGMPDHSTISCDSNGGNHGGLGACLYEFISTDSGQHWQAIALPVTGQLSGSFIGGGMVAQADGSQTGRGRLYSVVSVVSVTEKGGQRLVKSDDGGVSWQFTDAAIVSAGQKVMDFSAAPSATTASGSPFGATVYALTAAADALTSGGNFPPLTIWRSDDAGATWSNLGASPSDQVLGIRAAMVAGSGKPLLYLLTQGSSGHNTIMGSLYGDSGSYHTAPDPSPVCRTAGDSVLLGTLSDGSVVISCGGVIEEWIAQPNERWVPLARTPDIAHIAQGFTLTPAGGATQLWLTSEDNSAQVEYATLPTIPAGAGGGGGGAK